MVIVRAEPLGLKIRERRRRFPNCWMWACHSGGTADLTGCFSSSVAGNLPAWSSIKINNKPGPMPSPFINKSSSSRSSSSSSSISGRNNTTADASFLVSLSAWPSRLVWILLWLKEKLMKRERVGSVGSLQRHQRTPLDFSIRHLIVASINAVTWPSHIPIFFLTKEHFELTAMVVYKVIGRVVYGSFYVL